MRRLSLSLSLSLSKWLAMCLALITAHQAAKAQSQFHVAPINFSQGAWQYRAIYDSSQQAPAVVAILAIAQQSSTVGDNLVAVIYFRNSDGHNLANDTWTSKSWDSTDPKEVLASVVSSYNLVFDDDLANLGTSVDDVARFGVPPDPEDYENGLLGGDPLALAVATDPNHDDIIDLLTLAGYKAADVPFEKLASSLACGSKAVLTAMAATAEQVAAMPVFDTSGADPSVTANSRAMALSQTYSGTLSTVCPGAPSLPIGHIKEVIRLPISPWFDPFTHGPVCNGSFCTWSREVRVRKIRVCVSGTTVCIQTKDVTCGDTVACPQTPGAPPAQPPCVVPPAVPLNPVRLSCEPDNTPGYQPPCAACGDAVQ